jgi:predicted DNA-binding transcriptional regulator AlpA
MRDEIQFAMKLAEVLPAAELPIFLGELEVVRCTAMARLTRSAAAQPVDVRMLDVAEASRMLGMSEDYLYRNWHDFPFAKKIGGRLLFSSVGIDRFVCELGGGLATRRR